jgi:hypothetical protein
LTPDAWDLRVEADRAKNHWYRGKKYDFDQLFELRRSKKIAEQITPKNKQDHFDRCQRSLEGLREIYSAAKPDAAVIFGNDQFEVFTETNIPAFAGADAVW